MYVIEIRVLDGHEMPLKLQLGHSRKKPYLELRLLQVRDTLATPRISSVSARGGASGLTRVDSQDSLEGDNGHNIVPKEEGEGGREGGREGGKDGGGRNGII